MDDKLAPISMQIIILAGDSRKLAHEAGDAIAEGDFSQAAELLELAQGKIREAHMIHTDCIQAAAAGEEFGYSMLFTHAQDTLMTVNSEFRLMKKLANVFEKYDVRIRALEETKKEIS